MQTLPTGWVQARSGLYRWEAKLEIAGEEYDEGRIYGLTTKAALYSAGTASIGGCVAKEIDISILPKGEIPRMAEIKVYVRPVARGVETGWLQKGVFYIDTRQTDRVTGVMTIHGYDAMLKAEQTYLAEGDTGAWPRAMSVVAADIALRMGVSLDSRTAVRSDYMVEYPNDYTMREVLGYIAVAHAGNWILTDAGKLRLVGLADIPEETYYLISDDGDAIMFGDTRIIV